MTKKLRSIHPFGLSNVIKLMVIPLVYILINSCDVFNSPSEIKLPHNPYDGRNPEAVPEVLNVDFKFKLSAKDPAIISISTKAATEIRYTQVNQTGDPITSGYQAVQSEYQLNLSVGNHVIAAQGKALNGNESVVMYQTINVVIGYSAGEECSFPLGNSDKEIVMCWIPPGSFDMGSPGIEQDRDNDEGPVHKVIFMEGYWMGKYEVTQDQWEAVMGNNPSYFGGADRPVEQVSWNDIQEFESSIDNSFRLPSEAEWEYACRAGTSTRFYWGEDGNAREISNYAVYSSNAPGGTASVGTKQANAWGLNDMSGNVFEWCEDWYHSDYTNAPADSSAWTSPSGSHRVNRGGSWYFNEKSCRSGNRYGDLPLVIYHNLGFRLVRSF